MSELTDYIGLDRLKVTVLTSKKIGVIIAARARAQEAPVDADDANFRDSVAILCAALSQTHPEASPALIEGLEGTVIELQAAVMAIMDRAGFVAAGEATAGESGPVAISSGNSATSTAPSPPAAAIPRRKSTK